MAEGVRRPDVIDLRGRQDEPAVLNVLELSHGSEEALDEVRSHYASGEWEFIGLQVEGQVVGCAYLRVTGMDAYLGLLSVLPRRQGRGFGSELLAECERFAHEDLGCHRLCISVITSHRPDLTAFYERRGFERTGKFKSFERKQALQGKKVDGMLLEWMEKPLSVPAMREPRMRFMPNLI